MTLKSLITALALLAFTAGAQTLHAEESPGKFVQDFYDWYLPMTSSNHSESSTDAALRKKGAAFSPELAKALKEDSVASAKSPNDIVGLDWDPFLNSQEPMQHYVVGNITEKNGAFRVDVYGVSSGKKEKKPSVIAEVKQENGHWFFVNFWRPGGGNLLSDLRKLSNARKKNPK